MTKVTKTEAAVTTPRRDDDDIEARIAACEALVEADTARIDETLESLDGTPEEIFEGDASIVRHVEDVRVAARRSARAAAASHPPDTVKVGVR